MTRVALNGFGRIGRNILRAALRSEAIEVVAIIDVLSTAVIGGNLLRIVAWYDNKTGYSQRVVDLAEFIAGQELRQSAAYLSQLVALQV